MPLYRNSYPYMWVCHAYVYNKFIKYFEQTKLTCECKNTNNVIIECLFIWCIWYIWYILFFAGEAQQLANRGKSATAAESMKCTTFLRTISSASQFHILFLFFLWTVLPNRKAPKTRGSKHSSKHFVRSHFHDTIPYEAKRHGKKMAMDQYSGGTFLWPLGCHRICVNKTVPLVGIKKRRCKHNCLRVENRFPFRAFLMFAVRSKSAPEFNILQGIINFQRSPNLLCTTNLHLSFRLAGVGWNFVCMYVWLACGVEKYCEI